MHKKFLQTFLAVASLASVSPLAAMDSDAKGFTRYVKQQPHLRTFAHASAAVYGDSGESTEASRRVLEKGRWFKVKEMSDWGSGMRMETYESENDVIIAFKGTDWYHLANISSDIGIYWNRIRAGNGRPQTPVATAGLWTAFQMVWAPLVTPVNQCLEWTDVLVESYDRPMRVHVTGHSLGGFMANAVTELANDVPTTSIVYNAPGGVARLIEDEKQRLKPYRDFSWNRDFWKPVATLNFGSKAESHNFRHMTINVTNDAVGHIGVGGIAGDDNSRRSLVINQGLGAHSIASLLNDLDKF